MDRAKLMEKVMAYSFAAYEWNLYLDTHPYDTNAIKMHREVSKKAMDLKNEYESKYGPIEARDSTSMDSWDWVDEPWPWDNK